MFSLNNFHCNDFYIAMKPSNEQDTMELDTDCQGRTYLGSLNF